MAGKSKEEYDGSEPTDELREWLEESFDSISAGIFTGDNFIASKKARTRAMWYMKGFIRELEAIDAMEQEELQRNPGD